jgi:hypothetical protein
MSERFEKKTTYQFCGLRNLMVQLEIVQSTAVLEDMVHAHAKIAPVSCGRQNECRRMGVRCIVYDRDGQDPCPEVWKGEW